MSTYPYHTESFKLSDNLTSRDVRNKKKSAFALMEIMQSVVKLLLFQLTDGTPLCPISHFDNATRENKAKVEKMAEISFSPKRLAPLCTLDLNHLYPVQVLCGDPASL